MAGPVLSSGGVNAVAASPLVVTFATVATDMVMAAYASDSATGACTYGGSPALTQVVSNTSSADGQSYYMAGRLQTGSAANLSTTNNADTLVGLCDAFSGVDQTTQYDVVFNATNHSASSGTAGTTTVTRTITTATDNALVWVSIGWDGTSTTDPVLTIIDGGLGLMWTPSTAYQSAGFRKVARFFATVPLAGTAVAISFSSTVSGGYGFGIVALRAVAGPVVPTFITTRRGIKGPGRTPNVLNQFVMREGIATISPDITLSLSGVDLSTSAGTLAIAISKALTGEAPALSAGALVPAISKALAGELITSAAGTLAPARSLSLTGSPLALAAGSISVASGVGLAGQAVNTATGSLAVGISIGLTGQQLTISTGTITYSSGGNITLTLAGTAITLTTGTLSPSLAKSLAGEALTLSAGQLGITHAVSLSGSQLNIAAGQLAAALGVSLSGVQASLATGTLTYSSGGNVTITLSGIDLSIAVGSITAAHALTLAGAQASLTTGFISVVGPAGPLPTVAYAAPEGLVASNNPWGSNVEGFGPLAAGRDGLIIGRFAWVNAELMTISNVWASGLTIGFVPLIQSSYPALYISVDGLLRLRAGYAAYLANYGDFWARFPYGASAGDRVYAAIIDGAVISGQAADAMPTPWKVATTCAPGELAIITTWS